MAKRRANTEGTLFQRKSDLLWIGRIPNGFYPNGKVKYVIISGKEQADVVEKMKKSKSEIYTHNYIEPNAITVSDWLEKWLNITIKTSIKNSTWISYERLIHNHIIPCIGGIKLSKLQTSDLQKFYNDKQTGARLDKKKVNGKMVFRDGGISASTIRQINVIMHSALKQALSEQIIHHNIAEFVKLPKLPTKEMKTLDIKDIDRFLEAAKRSRYYMAFYLELYTGMRKGELLGIRWKDIDFKNGKIKVVQQLVKEKKYVIRELKTESSQNRVIAIPDEVINELKEHKYKQELELRSIGKNDIEIAEHFKTGLVFTGQGGLFVQPRYFDKCCKYILSNAKLDDIRIHDLRHTFGLLSLQAGADIKTLQSDLGHRSISTTLDVYGHVNEEMKRDAANKRSTLLKSVINSHNSN